MKQEYVEPAKKLLRKSINQINRGYSKVDQISNKIIVKDVATISEIYFLIIEIPNELTQHQIKMFLEIIEQYNLDNKDNTLFFSIDKDYYLNGTLHDKHNICIF